MIVAKALQILEARAHYGDAISSPTAAREYCRLRFGGLEHEVFAVAWLDSQHRVLAFEELFRGTLNQTAVYPREVVKAGIRANAASAILVHNHPSGATTPSEADRTLTAALKAALTLVDIRVLDHLIVTASETTSMAERGYL